MTQEKMLSYLTVSNMRDEQVGGYVLSKIIAYLYDRMDDDQRTAQMFLKTSNETTATFLHQGLGAVTIAYLAHHYPNTPEQDLRINDMQIGEVLQDFETLKEQLDGQALPRQVDLGVHFMKRVQNKAQNDSSQEAWGFSRGK